MIYSYNGMLFSNKKGINYWYKHQYEWISKALSWTKEAKHKRTYTALCDFIYIKPQDVQQPMVIASRKWLSLGQG